MKTCTGCLMTKPVEEFHKKGAGYRTRCKGCRRQDHLDNPQPARERAAQSRANNYARTRTRNEDWKKKNKARYDELRERWRQVNPLKVRAHWTVSNYLRNGRLTKRPCEVCGVVDVHAHHDDYTKPLSVRWLCVQHHTKVTWGLA